MERTSVIIFKYLAVMIGLLIFTPIKTQAIELKPIQPLYIDIDPEPFYELGTHIASDTISVISNYKDYKKEKKKIEEFEDDISAGKSVVRNQIRLFDSLVASRNYIDMVSHGMYEYTKKLGKIEDATYELNYKIRMLGKKLAKDNKSDRRKTRYLYYAYANAPYTTDKIKKLIKISKNKYLGDEFKSAINFIRFHKLISKTSILGKKKRISTLEKKYYKSFSKLNIYGQMSAALSLARAYAGLTYDDRHTKEPISRYMAYLKISAIKAKKAPEIAQEIALDHMINIFVRAADGNPDFYKMSFNIEGLQKTRVYLAVMERVALANYKNGNIERARKINAELSMDKTLFPSKVFFLERVLKWENHKYQNSGNYASYESEIISQHAALKNDIEVFQTQYLPVLKKHYKRLVVSEYKEVKKGSAGKKNSSKRKPTVALIDRYVKAFELKNNDLAQVQFLAGEIYVHSKQDRNAVSRFLRASDNAESRSKKVKYLNFAIKSQARLAKWPTKIEWDIDGDFNPKDLKVLAKLYKDKNRLQRPFNWNDIANEGLIQNALNQQRYSTDLFYKYLQRESSSKTAENAAHFTLKTLFELKDWARLEKASIFIYSHGVLPKLNGSTLNPKTYVAASLFEGGLESYNKKDYKEAARKFDEYAARIDNDKKVDAQFYIVKSLWNDGQYKESIEENKKFVNSNRTSKHYQTATLMGFERARSLGLEDDMLFFLSKYTEQYSDEKSLYMRWLAVKLHVAREEFDEAIAQLKILISDNGTDTATKSLLTVSLFDVSNESSSVEYVNLIADQLLSRNQDPGQRARAYLIKSQLAFLTNRGEDLEKHKNIVSVLDSNNSDVRYVHSSILYMQAKLVAKTLGIFESSNSSSKSQIEYVQQIEKSGGDLYSLFKRVCEPGDDEICVRSLFEFNRLAVKLNKDLDQIVPFHTYTPEELSDFDNAKIIASQNLTKMITDSIKLSDSKVEKGEMLPYSVNSNLWKNGLDWNFDLISDGGEYGYIEWGLKANEKYK